MDANKMEELKKFCDMTIAGVNGALSLIEPTLEEMKGKMMSNPEHKQKFADAINSTQVKQKVEELIKNINGLK